MHSGRFETGNPKKLGIPEFPSPASLQDWRNSHQIKSAERS
jgi:hypothetical protein